MNIYDKKVADKELSTVEWKELEEVSLECPWRYGYYRRQYPMETKQWCIDAAKNWAENKSEQADRRKDHGTGAT